MYDSAPLLSLCGGHITGVAPEAPEKLLARITAFCQASHELRGCTYNSLTAVALCCNLTFNIAGVA